MPAGTEAGGTGAGVPAPSGTRPVDDPAAVADGCITVVGRMPNSSNATFLVVVGPEEVDADALPHDDRNVPQVGPGQALGIYKPGRGERPLWDFPPDLWQREVAAFELSRLLGWRVIPATVRRDGPYGAGSVQRFVDARFEEHYFTLYEQEELRPQLLTMGVFDVLANNADRKGGHCLIDADGRIWGIDNGLCFHVEPKLRTVIWEFAGEPLPDDLLADVTRLAGLQPGDDALAPLAGLLDGDELESLLQRARRLLHRGVLPHPRSDRAYPWPLV